VTPSSPRAQDGGDEGEGHDRENTTLLGVQIGVYLIVTLEQQLLNMIGNLV
jgi:hypothetical protein